jgi:hypothetical protein
MSSDIVKGMARAFVEAKGNDPDYRDPYGAGMFAWEKEVDAMRACLNWFADNVTDDVVLASILLPNDPKEAQLRLAFKSPKHKDTIERVRASISRALRAAAGEERK